MTTVETIRTFLRAAVLIVVGLLTSASVAGAEAVKAKAPDMGYIFPAGGAAGTTVNVVIGGPDWTPDMQIFVHHPGVEIVPTAAPGPVLIPDPPYWIGPKGMIPDPPLVRETPARIVIPADCPPGPIFWQAASANGSTATGVFMVSHDNELLELEDHGAPQSLASLNVTISGRLSRIEEVDAYRFTAARDGIVTCTLDARRLGSQIHGVIEVRDSTGRLIADAFDTEGNDAALSFAAQKGASYVVSVRDVDFRGDRSYGYRLSIVDGPRVVAVLPAAGRRGETRSVEFVGLGLASGAERLESVKREVSFPNSPARMFEYHLETPFGRAAPVPLLLSDLDERVEPDAPASSLPTPAAVTGALEDLAGEDLYHCQGKKGEVWSIAVQAREIGSLIDPLLVIRGDGGKELVRADDAPGTSDCRLVFTLPADGDYALAVADLAGKAGSRAATYRLVVEKPTPDFKLQTPLQHTDVFLGEKKALRVEAQRRGGFNGPIALSISGLPEGVTVVGDPLIPADKNDVTLSLESAADAPAVAAVARIIGKAQQGDRALEHAVLAPAAGNLVARTEDESTLGAILIATTLKPVASVESLDKDGAQTVHRGATYPARMVIQRFGGFDGEIVMQMAARQQRHRQGITARDVVVPAGDTRAVFPCYLPECVETSRTSRMAVLAVAKAADPRGNIRYLVSAPQGYITMTVEGALLKLTSEARELSAPVGTPINVPLKIFRSETLARPARLELRPEGPASDQFQAEPVNLAAGQSEAAFRINARAGSQRAGRYTIHVRATVIDNHDLPVISETSVPVEIVAGE